MNTVIFRTIAPYLSSLMALFSVFVLLRGHNEPGGGFIGGLIAASAIAIYGIAEGVAPARRAIHFHPMHVSGFGLALALASGLPSLATGLPFMTGRWTIFEIGEVEIALSTVLAFDVGVYFVVAGALSSIALALEEKGTERAEQWRRAEQERLHGAEGNPPAEATGPQEPKTLASQTLASEATPLPEPKAMPPQEPNTLAWQAKAEAGTPGESGARAGTPAERIPPKGEPK